VMLPQINWRQPRNQRRLQTNREAVPVVETIGDSAGKNNGKRRTTRRARAAG
jgi:hypothetical protein